MIKILRVRTIQLLGLIFCLSEAQASSTARNLYQFLDGFSSLGVRRVVYPHTSLTQVHFENHRERVVSNNLWRTYNLSRITNVSKDVAVVRLAGQVNSPENSVIVSEIVKLLHRKWSPIPQNTAIYQALQNRTDEIFSRQEERDRFLRLFDYTQNPCNQTIVFLSPLEEYSSEVEKLLSSLEIPYNFVFMDEKKSSAYYIADRLDMDPFMVIYKEGKPVFSDVFQISHSELPGKDLFLSRLIERFFSNIPHCYPKSFPDLQHFYSTGPLCPGPHVSEHEGRYAYSKFQSPGLSGMILPFEFKNRRKIWKLMIKRLDGTFSIEQIQRLSRD